METLSYISSFDLRSRWPLGMNLIGEAVENCCCALACKLPCSALRLPSSRGWLFQVTTKAGCEPEGPVTHI